jgi:membrane-associated PAP2 superfamily phosphatase
MVEDLRTPTDDRRFWLAHAWWPAAAFVAVSVVIVTFDLDRRIAHAWFYDLSHGTWLGQGSGAWWARDLLHSAGRWLARLVALAALMSWLATFLGGRRCRALRRRAAFAFLAIVLATGVVGGLKAVTNVDCPWDLAEFNGDRPYVGLLADRPAGLPPARCFPGAHASSGFALIFGYFLLRDSSRQWARGALAGGLLVGLLFSLGQEARGAHFVSHDLTSAGVVWFVQLPLYRVMLVPAASSSTE